MSAFMDALRSCTGLSGPYSCSNGPLRSSSLRAEKAGRPSGRPVVEGELALSWTRCAFIHMTRAIKEHHFHCFSLSVSSAFSCAPPPHPHPYFLPTSDREKGANCLLWEPKIIEPPIFLLPLPFSPLFQAPYSFFLKTVVLSERQGKKSVGIFLRNVDVKKKASNSHSGSEGSYLQAQEQDMRVVEVCLKL